MGRPDEPTVSFIDKCMENELDTYKAFKVRPVSFLGGLQIFLMAILFPRKKNGFNPEFEDFFKDYEINNGREYGGYNKKDTIRMAIKKNKKTFEVLYNKHGILIFRKKMNAEMESLIGEDFTSNEIESPYKGSVPDSDTIEEIYEKIMNELILPKLKRRITHAADMISISSGYGSSPVSPFSETSSTINSPINLESLSDLLSDFGNTMNSTSRDLSPYISLEQVQSSSEQSLDQQLLTNNFMPENDSLLDNTSKWCEELLNYKLKMNELKQPRQEARKADQPEETENDSLLDDISKWCEELLNSKEKMNELKQLHEEAQKTDQPGETENSKADEQQVISNSSPPFVECGTFESSSFDNISSVTFNGKSDAYILEQSIDNFSEAYSGVLHPVKEEDKLILDVLNMEDLFEKYSSLTDIPALKKVQRYPSCVDFSSVHFEFLEEMDTSESGLLNTSHDMDCS